MNRRTPRRCVSAVLLAVAALALGGCGGDTAGPETGADIEDIQQEGAAPGDSGAFDNPQSFAGEEVTVSATVSEIISPAAFTIAGANAEQLLVLHDGTPQLESGAPVRVTGTVLRAFDVAAAEEFVGEDLVDPLLDADFGGEPYIQASGIDTGVAGEVR